MVLKNKNILITGSYGFIGSNLKKKLNKNNKIINIGHKKSKQDKKNSLTIENLLNPRMLLLSFSSTFKLYLIFLL